MHNSANNELDCTYSGSFSNKMRENRSTDINQGQNKTNVSSLSGFNVYCVYDKFAATLREPNNPKSPIGTQDYIDSYRELIKFLDQLGYIFKFVKDDVIDKLKVLQSFIDKDKKSESHFDTIEKAIDYETEHNFIKTNPDNFTRTLLRLHRALIFIVEFLRSLIDRPLSESTTTIAIHCYETTLYHHHSFLVRQSVKMGFLLLPSRRQLDDIIFHGHKAELLDQYKTFIKIIQQIFDTIETLYAENNYLQLP
ncbi:unnamed protein product [Rotaria socialis]|uniref:Glycolipid transfer protein domain-containing protein n=2 Tax=Rotaria socialis TaxID=392032 RepID=A0A818CCM8_9BILA|nr:unnamed protein product [Rotaria socialis]CAF3427166.1 unnamed protein product [Rotaria socialis]CAF3445464.1 unnamed protein product [Rotaria socialis]CAF3540044.1 unnamed protein product [Rotaria socialis]CAF4374709.1 unnamed protein product [Rotaria socialis]